MSLWPWWLWALCALWIGTSLAWQPAANAARERLAWTVLAVMYAGLIVFVTRITPDELSTGTDTGWMLWLALGTFLISAVTVVGWWTPRLHLGIGIATAASAGTVLAWLHAPEAAIAAVFLGIMLARTAGKTSSDPQGAVPRANQWLVGLAGVVTLVVLLGVCRHALLSESQRTGISRSQTVFPTRGFLAKERSSNPPSEQSNTVFYRESWGLIVVVVIAAATSARRRSTHELREETHA